MGYLLFASKNTTSHSNIQSSKVIPTVNQIVSPTISREITKGNLNSLVRCTNLADDWKLCKTDKYIVTVPQKWLVNDNDPNLITYSNDYLEIATSNDKFYRQINSNDSRIQTRQTIYIGNEQATQYYGCLGGAENGCLNMYIVQIKHNNLYYEIDFFPYDLPTSVYKQIIASFNFVK